MVISLMLKKRIRRSFVLLVLLIAGLFALKSTCCKAKEKANATASEIEELLAEPVIDVTLPWQQLRSYVGNLIPEPLSHKSVEEWESRAEQIRQQMFDLVVFRGKAQKWREAPFKVEWFDTIETNDGYRIKKFRYEALPGMWAPALLYEPAELTAAAPVFINLNGHHRGGKAMPYKQRRCINLAKRGMLAYNLEFLDMGQLYNPNRDNKHNRLVQIDLCGTSGLAPFWLIMERGLDVALQHEHADSSRVGVAGLSGGGWQTIWLASLDKRITLANPVAGYGSNHVRLDYRNNVGDAEQIPSDMTLAGDYTHMTAMIAPRPLLLTNNAEDNCCFKPQEVFPRLEKAALPIYHLYERMDNFRTHTNYDPGTHNFDADNREALYRLLQDKFFDSDPHFNPKDLPVADADIKTETELAVPMPEENATLHSLAVELSRSLPKNPALPTKQKLAAQWQESARKQLHQLVRSEKYQSIALIGKVSQLDKLEIQQVTFQLDKHWTLPAVTFTPASYDKTVILIGDDGRKTLTEKANHYLAQGRRVIAVDLTGFGEAKGDFREIEPLLIASVGRRPLGVYAGQLNSIADWAKKQVDNRGDHQVIVDVSGPRSSVVALIASALAVDTIDELYLDHPWGSLKQLIEQNLTAEDAPEQFCFGLLEHFDIPQLIALVAPKPVHLRHADEQLRSQADVLKQWYATVGVELDPFQ